MKLLVLNIVFISMLFPAALIGQEILGLEKSISKIEKMSQSPKESDRLYALEELFLLYESPESLPGFNRVLVVVTDLLSDENESVVQKALEYIEINPQAFNHGIHLNLEKYFILKDALMLVTDRVYDSSDSYSSRNTVIALNLLSQLIKSFGHGDESDNFQKYIASASLSLVVSDSYTAQLRALEIVSALRSERFQGVAVVIFVEVLRSLSTYPDQNLLLTALEKFSSIPYLSSDEFVDPTSFDFFIVAALQELKVFEDYDGTKTKGLELIAKVESTRASLEQKLGIKVAPYSDELAREYLKALGLELTR